MQTTATAARSAREEDQRVRLHGVRWEDYERLLAIRGESAAVRITYLSGEVELMSPSRHHERIKSMIGRLVELYAVERGIDLAAFGSWTIKDASNERGAEPDECYVLGTDDEQPTRPDLAVEVVWTSGGADKLDVYRGLGVREVWFWQDGRITVHVLEGDRYLERARSECLPGLDVAFVARLAAHPNQALAVREFLASLRGA